MKKRLTILLLILFIIPFSVFAEDLTYEEAQKAVKETIQAWYMRGSYRQYNSSKNTYANLRHPEDSTSQEFGYSVCSGFTNDVLMETFGFQAGTDTTDTVKTPSGSEAYCKGARSYIDQHNCKTSTPNKTGCKGEYVVYYSNKTDKIIYYYDPKGWATENPSVTNFVQLLQPGDIVSYNGHVVVVYDFKYDSKGNKIDALLFESGSGGLKVMSKIDPDEVKLHLLYFRKLKNQNKNGLLDINTDNSYMPYEGTVKWRWFSEYNVFVKDGKVSCQKDMCSITRGYYKGSGGKAVLNFDVEWPQQIKTSKARIELPGIFIAKTSSKYDNNSVIMGDTITYTIRIHNNSNMVNVKGTNQKQKYSSFHVVETLPSEVEFVSATVDNSQDGTYDEKNRTITWNVSSLNAGESILLKYKVKVTKKTSNIGHFIEANGKVYKSSASYYIPTGTVQHEIIRTTSKTDKEYSDCYEKSKKAGATSAKLIQNTYECLYGKDLGFSFEDFYSSKKDMLDQLITRPYENPSKMQTGALRLINKGDTKIYSDMVLNNYWGGLVRTTSGKKDGSSYYILPRWRKESTSSYIGEMNRAKTIFSGHFKTGDVLIYYMDKANTRVNLRYTTESGLYAYIFLDGKFVGINHTGDATRNEFTKDYYANKAKDLYDGSSSYYDFANYQTLQGKDTYVIFRPEKVITEISSIKVKTPPIKTTYYQNQKLDVTGGVITATNNDGTKKDVEMTNEDVKVSKLDSSKSGEQTITVTYEGKSTTFKVMVEESTITSIQVKTPPSKTSYFVGEELNLTGGIIQANYSNGTSKTYSMRNSGVKITGFDSSKVGTNTLTITYSEKITTLDVQIVYVSLSTISIEKYPNKLTYVLGEDLDLTNGVLKKTYNNSTSQNVNMSDSSVTVSGFNKNQVGTQTVTFTTEGKSVTMDVVVNNSSSDGTRTLDSITVYSNPSKINYHIGESLNLSGGKIKAKYIKTVGSSTEEQFDIIDMSNSNINVSGFSSTEEGEKTLTVTYSGKTATFPVVVSKKEAKIHSIAVTKLPRKKRYIQYRESLDATGGELTITYTDDTTKVIALTDAEVSLLDFDNQKLEEQQVHVIYKGLETSFPVTIYEQTDDQEYEEDDTNGPIKKIEIIHNPTKTEYMQGEDEFDVSGITFKILYEDGKTYTVDLTDVPGKYFITGFDNSVVGEQTVIINYQGYQVPIKVNIQKAKDDVIDIPDTLARKSFWMTLIAITMIATGAYIILKNAKSNA